MISAKTLPHGRILLRRFATNQPYKGPAFVFDIDGVLIRGGSVLPAAQPALQTLYDQSRSQWRTPITFLTNGGGTTEAARAEKLTNLLNVPVQEHQIVLSHSPLKNFMPMYADSAVLTVGNPHCAEIARSYGFQHVISTEALAYVDSNSTPFARLEHVQPSKEDYRVSEMPIGAVFVMTDSRDWGRDIQLLIDILRSDGHRSRRHSNEQVVHLYFCNPDILFPTEYHLPRLAGGSFCVALQAVYSHVTGKKLSFVQLGKPHAPNYQLAEGLLRQQLAHMGYCAQTLPTIYAIGDNPPSDVRGANARGHPWRSVLVRTGNFKGHNDEVDAAHIVVDNVEHAVKHALDRHEVK